MEEIDIIICLKIKIKKIIVKLIKVKRLNFTDLIMCATFLVIYFFNFRLT